MRRARGPGAPGWAWRSWSGSRARMAARSTCCRERAAGSSPASPSPRRALDRADLHLPPLDHAPAPLQRERAARELAVLDVDRLLAVEDHHQAIALHRDVVGVPLATGLVDLRDLRHLH